MSTNPARDPIGTVRRTTDGEVWVGTAEQWRNAISGELHRADEEMTDSEVIGVVPGTPASDSADVVTVRRDDVERTRLALQELEQWRTGSRITQESSDQQDRAIKAEHELADTRHRLEAAEKAMAGMVSELDDARADLADAQESRQAWAIEADNQTQIVEILRRRLHDAEHIRHEIEIHLDRAIGTQAEDGAGQGLAADVALLVQRYTDTRDQLARAHQYIGGLLLADPIRFPGSAEQAAARVVDLDPPSPGLTARVQHAVSQEAPSA